MSLASRVAATALTLALVVPAAASAQDTEHVVSVVGKGQIELRPDRGSFGVGVGKRERSANAARSFVNRRLRRIVGALREAGVERSQLTTSQISVYRQRRPVRKDGPVKTTYVAEVAIEVDVEGLRLVGRAMDAATRAGATNVFGPRLSFTAPLRSLGRRRAEADALRDARERAEAAAAAEGQQIVDVQSIDLDPGEGSFSPFAFDAAAAGGGRSSRDARTEIFAAKRTVSSRARVTYVIQPVPAS